MKFMGDAVDEIRLHLGKLFLPLPVAKSDKKQEYYGKDGEQGQKKGRHHKPQDSSTAVADVDMESETHPVGVGKRIGNSNIDHLVPGQRFLKSTADPDTILCLDRRIDQRIAIIPVIEINIFKVTEHDGYIIDEQHIFKIVVQSMRPDDPGQDSVSRIVFPQGGENAVTELLFQEIKRLAIGFIQIFEQMHIGHKKTIDDLLPPGHHFIISDGDGILSTKDGSFFQVKMIIL